MTSATSGWIGAPPKARPGLGSSRRISASHVGDVLLVDAANLAQSGEIALGASSGRLATSACIAGSKRSRSRSWMARHSARSRAPTPGGSKRLNHRQHALDRVDRRVEAVGDLGDVVAQIAGLVDRVDEDVADQPHRRGSAVGERSCSARWSCEATSGRRHRPRDWAPRRSPGRRRRPVQRIRRQARAFERVARRRGWRGRRLEGVADVGAEARRRALADRPRGCPASSRPRRGSPKSARLGVAVGCRLGDGVFRSVVGLGAVLARSSSGLRSSSSSTKAASSRLENCRSLIACRSCGVITRDWPWRIISLWKVPFRLRRSLPARARETSARSCLAYFLL